MPNKTPRWPRLRSGNGPSPLELELKAMITSMPGLSVEQGSPSGPYCHAVLFITDDQEFMGNAHQATPDPNSGWTARALVPGGGYESLREGHVSEFNQLPELITTLLATVRTLSSHHQEGTR